MKAVLKMSAITSQSETILIFPIGLFLLVMLFAIFLAGVILSVMYAAFRKPIGAGLTTIGILEIVPFLLFISGLNDITLLMPFIPLTIIFLEGCVTTVGGVAIFFFAKPKKPQTN